MTYERRTEEGESEKARQTPWARALEAEGQSEKELEQEACLVCLKNSWDSDGWSRRAGGSGNTAAQAVH